jgi:acyl carrier protein
MTELDPEVLGAIFALLNELKEDWEYGDEILPDTRFIADLGLESLDIVVLSTMIQQRYGRLPFPEYFEEVGGRPVQERDVTVADLTRFVSLHRQPTRQEV